MPLTPAELSRLQANARRIRRRILKIVHDSGSGHVGAALSQTDALVALYARYLKIDAEAPGDPERDRLVLSKGHGGLGLAAILAERGFFPIEELGTFGETGARLGMHMAWDKVPGIEVSTGSLGHGGGVAVGIALGGRVQGRDFRTVCVLSDGELYEGSTWEAATAAAGFALGRLTFVVDRNRLTMDGFTEEQMPLEPLADKWRAFGWNAIEVDGHDMDELCGAFDVALGPERGAEGVPTVVIANTIKGRGVDFMEDAAKWHYGALDSDAYARALASVDAMYAPTGLAEEQGAP